MEHLGLFAKFWQPGRVKTRLAAELGSDRACRVYELFLSHLLHSLATVGGRRSIVFSPLDRATEFATAAGASWETAAQADGDLGVRMQAFFETALQSSQKVIVIGSDCPQLTTHEIATAFKKLEEQPVVLGPSTDGGYYLIGMKNECAAVFDNIDWSTDRVFAQTVERLESQSIGYACLEPKTDIDERPNLMAYHEQLKTSQPGDVDYVLAAAIAGVLTKQPVESPRETQHANQDQERSS